MAAFYLFKNGNNGASEKTFLAKIIQGRSFWRVLHFGTLSPLSNKTLTRGWANTKNGKESRSDLRRETGHTANETSVELFGDLRDDEWEAARSAHQGHVWSLGSAELQEGSELRMDSSGLPPSCSQMEMGKGDNDPSFWSRGPTHIKLRWGYGRGVFEVYDSR